MRPNIQTIQAQPACTVEDFLERQAKMVKGQPHPPLLDNSGRFCSACVHFTQRPADKDCEGICNEPAAVQHRRNKKAVPFKGRSAIACRMFREAKGGSK